jgi:hypothetical protein
MDEGRIDGLCRGHFWPGGEDIGTPRRCRSYRGRALAIGLLRTRSFCERSVYGLEVLGFRARGSVRSIEYMFLNGNLCRRHRLRQTTEGVSAQGALPLRDKLIIPRLRLAEADWMRARGWKGHGSEGSSSQTFRAQLIHNHTKVCPRDTYVNTDASLSF